MAVLPGAPGALPSAPWQCFLAPRAGAAACLLAAAAAARRSSACAVASLPRPFRHPPSCPPPTTLPPPTALPTSHPPPPPPPPAPRAARNFNNIEDGFYISPAFLDKLSIHVAKNFLDLPKIKVPLILGIWGGKGQGEAAGWLAGWLAGAGWLRVCGCVCVCLCVRVRTCVCRLQARPACCCAGCCCCAALAAAGKARGCRARRRRGGGGWGQPAPALLQLAGRQRLGSTADMGPAPGIGGAALEAAAGGWQPDRSGLAAASPVAQPIHGAPLCCKHPPPRRQDLRVPPGINTCLLASPAPAGKTFQCNLAYKKLGIAPIVMSAGELESGNAGEPAKLIRQRYREASDVIKKGRVGGTASPALLGDVPLWRGTLQAASPLAAGRGQPCRLPHLSRAHAQVPTHAPSPPRLPRLSRARARTRACTHTHTHTPPRPAAADVLPVHQ